MKRIWTDMDSEITIRGEKLTVGEVWDAYVGQQPVADFLNNDPRPIAEQCLDYANQVPLMFPDGDLPEWTDDDAGTLADALERYITYQQS